MSERLCDESRKLPGVCITACRICQIEYCQNCIQGKDAKYSSCESISPCAPSIELMVPIALEFDIEKIKSWEGVIEEQRAILVGHESLFRSYVFVVDSIEEKLITSCQLPKIRALRWKLPKPFGRR